MTGIVFTATNKMDGTVFLGLSKNNLNQVLETYESTSKQDSYSTFLEVIRVYGVDAYVWEIIDHATTRKELNLKRKEHLIRLWKLGVPLYNYSAVVNKEIAQFNTDGKFMKLFRSAKHAQETLGIPHATIAKTCRGTTKIANNFVFLYAEDFENEQEMKDEVKKRVTHIRKSVGMKKVCQYNLEGKRIASFDSAKKAHLATGIPQQSIKSCCIGKSKTAYNFVFVYPELFESKKEMRTDVLRRLAPRKRTK
jgi:hypothetical protein